MDAIVAVPVYKCELTTSEKASFLQLFKVLKAHKIYLFTYEGLDLQVYRDMVGNKFDVVFFDRSFFSGINGYNRLLLDPIFYGTFKKHRYILIYQLDCWVFKDALNEWCATDFDYIGAPWFEGFDKAGPSSPFLGVGNGGFSLRKTSSHLKVLRSLAYIEHPLSGFSKKKLSWQTVRSVVANLTIRNNTYYRFNNFPDNEDTFWGMVVPLKFKWFSIPEPRTASRFAMEVNAEYLYEMNGHELPFGCHAWEKYTSDLWNRNIIY